MLNANQEAYSLLSRVVFVAGDVSRSLQHHIPPLELNFVSKGGTLEVPPPVQLVKWVSLVA